MTETYEGPAGGDGDNGLAMTTRTHTNTMDIYGNPKLAVLVPRSRVSRVSINCGRLDYRIIARMDFVVFFVCFIMSSKENNVLEKLIRA